MQISHNGNSQKSHGNVGKIIKKIIGYDISSRHISTQIYTIANLKVPVLYMVALSELKLNKNSKHDEVVMYQNMLHPFSFQVVSGNILFAFVTDFLRKKTLDN